jgi:magnesium-protoporphyrin O-methyltransferase
MPSCCECEAIDRHFAVARAAEELATYTRRGPTGTARLILNSLRGSPLIESILDIGAGIGVLHHELLGTGTRSAVHVEAARAYIDVAQEESARRGHAGRVRFLNGDFLALAPSVASADLVTLDRVVCCYSAFEPLIRLSAERARRYYAVSFPHDRWYVRAHTRWQNYRRKRAGNPFRTFVHPVPKIHALIRDAGFIVRRSCSTMTWEVLVCVRRSMTDHFRLSQE